MVLRISEKVMAAFGAQASAREQQDFFVWWNSRKDRLGVLSQADAQALYAAASEAALDIGIQDNEENRIFLMAAALRLIPKPSPAQQILACDAVLRHVSDDERITELAALVDAKR